MRIRSATIIAVVSAAFAWTAATGGAGAYTYQVIYDLCSKRGCTDGAFPTPGLTMDLAGNIYGSAQENSPAHATIFELTPVPGKNKWKYAKLYSAKTYLGNGRFIFDVNGNIYGAGSGGSKGYGAVLDLLPDGDHERRSWKELSG